MEDCSVALCVVVGGRVYEHYAYQLRISFYKYFLPSFKKVSFHIINGEEGWPNGTMYRWHRLLENMPETDYVFLCDADMKFESTVGEEIISGNKITLTLHPGYVGQEPKSLPFERRLSSCCFVHWWDTYYAGGFAGGPRKELKRFANEIAIRIDTDMDRGITPIWHDESALNKVASLWHDIHTLSPSYCYPDNADYYIKSIWKEKYERKLVALDKTEGERGSRN